MLTQVNRTTTLPPLRCKSRMAVMFIGTGILLAPIAPFGSVLLTSSALTAMRRSTCEPAKGTTLVVGRQARIYSLPGSKPLETERIFGCLVSTGHSRQLNALPKPRYVFGKGRGVSVDTDAFALHAPWAAYPENFYGLDTSVLAVTVKNLRTGSTTYCRVGGNRRPMRPGPSVTDIALGRNGHVAWIGKSKLELFPFTFTRRVGACASIASREIESSEIENGEGIDLHSLILHGSMLTWINSGVTHTAALR